jgi:hypothetical protein
MTFIKELANKIILVIVFAAALNLSFHASLPDKQEENFTSEYAFNEHSFVFLPFRQSEFSQTVQGSFTVQTLPYIAFNDSWKSLSHERVLPDFSPYRQGYKEHPFIIVVRNLRI